MDLPADHNSDSLQDSPAAAGAWRAALQMPGFWPDNPLKVDLIETHISWVFLTRQFAFKLKKPVAYDFLDFRTLAVRRAACQDEVRLNRRLAPAVYLGVVAITAGGPLGVELAGPGETLDYLVQMRRLPEEQRLDLLLAASHWDPHAAEPLIKKLVHFYQQASPLVVLWEDHLATLVHHVRDNQQVLLDFPEELPEPLVWRAAQSQWRLLRFAPQLLQDRFQQGRVLEGHGDLRPEHIYLTPEPVILDCIEFKAEFRQLDVADELSFLAMECAALGQADFGRKLRDAVLTHLSDHPPKEVLAFYHTYRALVRAKVAALRSRQQAGAEKHASLNAALRYLQLANDSASSAAQPWLLVVGGLMGSGKSSLARELAEHWGLVWLRTDEIRRQRTPPANGNEPQSGEQATAMPAEFGGGNYQPELRRQVYELLFQQAENWLSEGVSVVLDGTFSELATRERARTLAERNHAKMILLWCECPAEIARARIERRLQQGGDISEARPELLEAQRQQADLPLAIEAALHLNTTADLTSLVQTVTSHLQSLLPPLLPG